MPFNGLRLKAQRREKLLARGPGALSDAKLLAMLLCTGIAGKGVLQMADELLQLKNDSALRNTDGPQGRFSGISGLLHATADDLKRVKGLGPAKRAKIVAVLELARRAMAQKLQEREVFADSQAVNHYLLHLAAAEPSCRVAVICEGFNVMQRQLCRQPGARHEFESVPDGSMQPDRRWH
jgi:DNA repair protein RadC